MPEHPRGPSRTRGPSHPRGTPHSRATNQPTFFDTLAHSTPAIGAVHAVNPASESTPSFAASLATLYPYSSPPAASHSPNSSTSYSFTGAPEAATRAGIHNAPTNVAVRPSTIQPLTARPSTVPFTAVRPRPAGLLVCLREPPANLPPIICPAGDALAPLPTLNDAPTTLLPPRAVRPTSAYVPPYPPMSRPTAPVLPPLTIPTITIHSPTPSGSSSWSSSWSLSMTPPSQQEEDEEFLSERWCARRGRSINHEP